MSETSEGRQTAEETEGPAEVVEAKKEKKPEKKKKKEKGVFTLYKIENDKLMRLRPVCERCGRGYFMADHGDRFTCGHCGLTRYKQS